MPFLNHFNGKYINMHLKLWEVPQYLSQTLINAIHFIQSAGRCYKNIIIYWKTLNNTSIYFGLETGFYRILHWLNLHVKYVKVNYIIQTCLISYAFASNFNPGLLSLRRYTDLDQYIFFSLLNCYILMAWIKQMF